MFLGTPVASACSSTSVGGLTTLTAKANIYGTTTSNSYGTASYSGTIQIDCYVNNIDIYLVSQYDTTHYWGHGPIDSSHSVQFSVGNAGQYIQAYTTNSVCGDSNNVSAASYLGGHCYYAPIRHTSPAEAIMDKLMGLGTAVAAWGSSLISSVRLTPIAPLPFFSIF